MPVYKLTRPNVYINEWIYWRCTSKGANSKKLIWTSLSCEQNSRKTFYASFVNFHFWTKFLEKKRFFFVACHTSSQEKNPVKLFCISWLIFTECPSKFTSLSVSKPLLWLNTSGLKVLCGIATRRAKSQLNYDWFQLQKMAFFWFKMNNITILKF